MIGMERSRALRPDEHSVRMPTWMCGRRCVVLERSRARSQISCAHRHRRPVLDGTGATFTAAAPHDGPIELCSLFPGELRGGGERLEYDRRLPRALVEGRTTIRVL
jgi:hypothetical protein